MFRVAATGGEPEPWMELVPGATWVLADEHLFWAPYSESSPVFRTSTFSGETTELFAEDPDESVKNVSVDDELVLVTLANSLAVVPVDGGEPRGLVGGASMSGGRPAVHAGQVYFGADLLSGPGPGIWRVDLNEPDTPELILPGFPVAFVVDDDALYAHVIPETPEEGTNGRIVRAPLAGGEVLELSDTSSRTLSTGSGFGPYQITSSALVVSGCNVYFLETCSVDPPSNEYRLVTTPKVPSL